MRAASERFDRDGYFADDIGAALRRRLGEIIGLVLLVLSVVTMLALATWSVQDPSLSHATGGPTRNLLGAPGAVAADLMIQLFGLASIALVLPVAVWGWRLITHRRLEREWLRLIYWLGAVLLASAFASCLPKLGNWPLPTGLGGVTGDALLRLPSAITGAPLAGWNLIGMAGATGLAMLAAVAGALGIGWPKRGDMAETTHREAEEFEEEEGRSAALIGWLVHSLLSLRAHLSRYLARRDMPRRPVPAEHAHARERFEPNLGRRRPAVAQEEGDEADEDEDEDYEEAEPAPRARKPRAPKPAPVRRYGSGYVLPPLNLLAAPKASDRSIPTAEEIEENAESLESVLEDFGVKGEIINARPGPVVTLYELEPAPGIKSSRVIGLADDIARSMSAVSARVAVVAGRNAIGIELPNENREKVYLREMLAANEFNNSPTKLPLCLGKTIGGEPVIVDLARMPHLLIAGTTGSGKSVAINTMILSLVYRLRPEQCRLIMIDPKLLE
ncbi:MAG: DNA translocase FtsK 4TM domain-containing protein, partial [Pseudorhodoplanes sp.]